MNLWGRWEQCRNCYKECGWDEPNGVEEDGETIWEHFYECSLGENCDTDFHCDKYVEDK